MKVAVRADGGHSVGLGHLGRCMALAQALASRGAAVTFIDVPRACRGWVRERGFRCAPSGRKRFDLVIADSYRFSPKELAALRRLGRTLLIVDDFGAVDAPCDWILSSHAYASSLRFHALPGTTILAGPKFHPLRREYWTEAARPPLRPRLRKILLTLGGGDRGDLPRRLTALIHKSLPKAQVEVVLGPFAAAPGLERRPGVRVHRAPASLRPLLLSCDAVVCAAGQTLYEAARAGTPAIALELGPDQRGNAESMAAAGAAVHIPAGGLGRMLKNLAAALRKLDRRGGAREKMSAAGRTMIDGRGALRVADAVWMRRE